MRVSKPETWYDVPMSLFRLVFLSSGWNFNDVLNCEHHHLSMQMRTNEIPGGPQPLAMYSCQWSMTKEVTLLPMKFQRRSLTIWRECLKLGGQHLVSFLGRLDIWCLKSLRFLYPIYVSPTILCSLPQTLPQTSDRADYQSNFGLPYERWICCVWSVQHYCDAVCKLLKSCQWLVFFCFLLASGSCLQLNMVRELHSTRT